MKAEYGEAVLLDLIMGKIFSKVSLMRKAKQKLKTNSPDFLAPIVYIKCSKIIWGNEYGHVMSCMGFNFSHSLF